MKQNILKNWQVIVIIFFVGLAAISYSYLGYTIKGDLSAQDGTKLIFNSPDETANYFFSYLYAESTTLTYPEPTNYLVEGLIAPRSMRFINGQVAPASFFGLMIFLGTLAKIFSLKFLLYFIPIISAFSLIYFYLLIKKVFNKEIAFFSTLLAAIFPAYWYYSTRSFFNNIIFLDFLIIGLYYLVLSLEKPKILYFILSGLFFGWSIFIRSSEVIWLGLLIFIILIINIRRIKFYNIFILIGIMLLTWLPIFYYNQIIYGQFLTFGYNYDFLILTEDFLSGQLTTLKQLLLPFGFNWDNIKTNFYNYFIKLFWWYFILIELGLALLIGKLLSFKFNEKQLIAKKVLIYLILFIIFSSYLIIFYGSWRLADHPDPTAVTIGTSYSRYFLPIYLFSLPLISYFIYIIFDKYKLIKISIYILIFCFFFYLSFNLVYLDQEEGIFKIKSNIEDYQIIAKGVLKITESNSIIIAERNDKIFFPVRKIIYKLNNDRDNQLIGLLITNEKIYWWRFKLTGDDLAYLKQQYFEKKYGWYLGSAIYCFRQQCLYPLKNITNVGENL